MNTRHKEASEKLNDLERTVAPEAKGVSIYRFALAPGAEPETSLAEELERRGLPPDTVVRDNIVFETIKMSTKTEQDIQESKAQNEPLKTTDEEVDDILTSLWREDE